jgi:hypothetical protein
MSCRAGTARACPAAARTADAGVTTYPSGWRAFAVDGATLLPAWARRYWPRALDLSREAWLRARVRFPAWSPRGALHTLHLTLS